MRSRSVDFADDIDIAALGLSLVRPWGLIGLLLTCRHWVLAIVHQTTDSFATLIKKPSAFLPIAMSITALSLLGLVAVPYGIVREPDEGPVAHIWQLLMAGQLPIVAYFLARWLPRLPGPTAWIFAVQITAVLAAMAPVYYFGL